MSSSIYASSSSSKHTSKQSSTASTSVYASSKSKTKSDSKAPPPPIVALPSMSSQLFSLPQANNMDTLPVHPTQSAQRHAESEAKLKKALERNIARQSSQPTTLPSHYPPRPTLPAPIYSEPSSPSSHSPPIMMRTRPKPRV